MYNLNPIVKEFEDVNVITNNEIIKEINEHKTKSNIIIECYPGVDERKVIKELNISNYRTTNDFFLQGNEVYKKYFKYITDDRVFGYMFEGELEDLLVEKYTKVKEYISQKGNVIVGTGANLFARDKDLIIYVDISRWNIQKGWREKSFNNWLNIETEEDILKKFKIGYFFEWRIGDKYKQKVLKKSKYYCDSNDNLKILKSNDFFKLLSEAVTTPFRTVPYFDKGVWGGQWMKEKFKLDKDVENFAWAFDGVPEENSILFKCKNKIIEMPAMNLILFEGQSLLGENVINKYGSEFPIRFDYLDTMGGQNLSLQVHPTEKYIKETFGMKYTQDESYYILDAKKGAKVYLGLKDGIDSTMMLNDLKKANKGEITFDAKKYINTFDAKKHDHFLIPNGTIHCSGEDVVVLEISSTPYIFTFKLWDWGRIGLDGKPRPVHLEHGEKNIDTNRTTKWVEKNLVNNFKKIDDTKVETGLHDLEPITSICHTINGEYELDTTNQVNMLCLVEGDNVKIKSIDNSFPDTTYFYGETFIIPSTINKVQVISTHEIKLIQAYIKK